MGGRRVRAAWGGPLAVSSSSSRRAHSWEIRIFFAFGFEKTSDAEIDDDATLSGVSRILCMLESIFESESVCK